VKIAMKHNATRIDVMQRHIAELLALLERERPEDDAIQITWIKRSQDACVIRDFVTRDLGGAVLEIRLAPVRSVISYATALHEIGHVRGRYQRSGNVMVREQWAWQWARVNARFWSPAMEHIAVKSLFAAKAALWKKGKLLGPDEKVRGK
jgi:hypothetical protein